MAEVAAQALGILFMRQFKKMRDGFRLQKIRVGNVVRETKGCVRAIEQEALGYCHHSPAARRRRPGQLPGSDLRREVCHRCHVDVAVAHRKSGDEERGARRHFQRQWRVFAFGVGDEQSARLPFWMSAQDHSTRCAGRVALFVVEPKAKLRFFCLCDGSRKSFPLHFACQVIRERNIANHSAKTLIGQFVEEGVLRCRLIRPRMNDLEDARCRGRAGKVRLECGQPRGGGREILRAPGKAKANDRHHGHRGQASDRVP